MFRIYSILKYTKIHVYTRKRYLGITSVFKVGLSNCEPARVLVWFTSQPSKSIKLVKERLNW